MNKPYSLILIVVFFSCTKNNITTDPKPIADSSALSKWTIQNDSFQTTKLSQYYSTERLLNFTSGSVITIYNLENDATEKHDSSFYSLLGIHFLSPIMSKTYAIVKDEIDVPYNPESCFVQLRGFIIPFDYTSTGKPGDSVKIVVSNDTVTATFKSATFLKDSDPSHLELVSGTLVGILR